jgi:hypothetical protein
MDCARESMTRHLSRTIATFFGGLSQVPVGAVLQAEPAALLIVAQ